MQASSYLPNRHIIYLYHQNLFFPHTSDAYEGFQAYPDGILRWQGCVAELEVYRFRGFSLTDDNAVLEGAEHQNIEHR